MGEPGLSQRAVVTGGAGFIGSEIARQLVERGHQVRVIDDFSKPGHEAPPGVEFHQADLTQPGVASKLFAGFDVCVNLAAKIGGIGYFHKYPATILSENNKLYSTTFEAAAEHGFSRMVYVSSSMVFESATSFPSREADLATFPPPLSAYGFSKLSGEWYCRAFADQFNLPYTICRPFNAYGVNELPGQEVGYAHVIPDLGRKILDGQDPLEILGDGQQTRAFTHVKDIARGIILAMESEAAINQDFNISASRETNVVDLAKIIFDACQTGREFRHVSVPSFTYDVPRRVPDTEKARSVLGFEAEVQLEDGVREAVDWLRRTRLSTADRVGGRS